MGVNLRLTVELDGLTFSDLYRLADMARAAGIPADQKVDLDGSFGDGNTSDFPHSIVVDLVDAAVLPRVVTLLGPDAALYADILADVLYGDGDVRALASSEDGKALQRLVSALRGHPSK